MQTRRQFLRTLAAGSVAAGPITGLTLTTHAAERGSSFTPSPVPKAGLRTIPSSGERISCIGMGTWITFDVPPDSPERGERVKVMEAFLEAGGSMVDSSPMYGHAENLVGHCLERMDASREGLFAASKIWTPIPALTRPQLSNTESQMGVQPMDLMQVHNLLALDAHLPKLQAWKEAGRIRYVGVTTSHGRRHAELERVLQSETIDFVQLTYNMRHRQAEDKLLPLAMDRGIGVIVNRPLERGALVERHRHRPLPGLARELGCQSWAQLFLLWIASHPAVTCAIPATTRVDHVKENLAVTTLERPDAQTRIELQRAFEG